MAGGISRMLFHPHWGAVLRIVLGGVFVYASRDKIAHPDLFAQTIMDYHMLPLSLIIPMAVVLPWIEFVSGALLVCGILRRGSTVVILGMLAVFVVAIVAALVRGIDIACGCFSQSPEGEKLAWETLVRDILLIGAGIYVLLLPRTTLEPFSRRR